MQQEWLHQVLGDGAEVSETDVKRLLFLFYIEDGYMASMDRDMMYDFAANKVSLKKDMGICNGQR